MLYSSGCIVAGNFIGDYIFSLRSTERSYLILVECCIGLLILSGIINIILLRPSKIFSPADKTAWTTAVYTKAVLTILLTPLPSKIAGALGVEFPREAFRFFIVVLIVLLSSFAKQWRDEKSIKPKYD